MTQREEFEAWWKSRQLKTFPKDYALSRLENWGRSYEPTAWDAWQAAQAAQPAQIPPGYWLASWNAARRQL